MFRPCKISFVCAVAGFSCKFVQSIMLICFDFHDWKFKMWVKLDCNFIVWPAVHDKYYCVCCGGLQFAYHLPSPCLFGRLGVASTTFYGPSNITTTVDASVICTSRYIFRHRFIDLWYPSLRQVRNIFVTLGFIISDYNWIQFRIYHWTSDSYVRERLVNGSCVRGLEL
jgi:hypothetical protein